jgi:hypothetical protein
MFPAAQPRSSLSLFGQRVTWQLRPPALSGEMRSFNQAELRDDFAGLLEEYEVTSAVDSCKSSFLATSSEEWQGQCQFHPFNLEIG